MLAGVLLAAAASVLGFVLVGYLTGPKSVRFEWELASVFGTAVGTTFLAVVTGILAWSTARDVAATERIAHDGELDRQDRIRPTVLIYPSAFSGWYSLEVRARNIGLGPAIGLRIYASNPNVDRSIGVGALAALPPESDWTIVNVPVDPIPSTQPGQGPPSPPAEWARMEDWKVSGDYLDRSQRNPYDAIDARHLRDDPSDAT